MVKESERYYQYCGGILRSDAAFPELPSASDRGAGGFSFSLAPPDARPASRAPTEADPIPFTTQHGPEYFLEFEDGVAFSVDAESGVVRCNTPPNSWVRHLLLDQVLPRALSHQGFMIVHGSAVYTDVGAVLFVGESGRGKSTLAGAFQEAGHPLLTDDCSRISIDNAGLATCTPTYRSLRLWPDSVQGLNSSTASEPLDGSSDKRRIDISTAAIIADPIHVAGVLTLAAHDPLSERPVARAVPASKTLTELISQCFRLDPTSPVVTRRIFEQATTVISAVPTGELHYRRDHGQLPLVIEEVLRWLSEA